MMFLREEWRKVYKTEKDIYYRSAILRGLLKDSREPKEISEIADRMETLPLGLQSYIAWDIVNNPATTMEIFQRVKDNKGMLATTDPENVKSAWERHHPCVSSI